MIFILICVLLAALAAYVLDRTFRLKYRYTAAVSLLLGASIVACIALAHNHAVSLIPEANDGIGISNDLASLIIGDQEWTHQLFKQYFHASVYASLGLLILLVGVLAWESRRRSAR